MGTLESSSIYGIQIRESANDGSDFSNASADYRIAFLGEDGLWHVKGSSGTVTDPFTGAGSVATDAIWDAAGDLAVGTGANTAARLALGATNGMALQRVSGAAAWALPPGYEFDYVQVTSAVGPSATTEGTANTVVTANAVTYDGSTVVLLQFFCPQARPDVNAVGRQLNVVWYDGSSSIGQCATVITPVSGNFFYVPIKAELRLTPSNASHTYSVRAYVSAGTADMQAGAGGNGNKAPMFIRQTKVS
jgi:hypothetical protein